MDRRLSQASATDTRFAPRHEERTPSVTVFALGSAIFALIAGMCFLLMSQGAVDDVSPDAAQDWTHDVSRAETSMLDPAPASTAQVLGGMSDAEGRPVDLKRVTDRVLDWYGYSPRSGQKLQTLLVTALSQEQSDAYIDTLLNIAARRGDFVVSAHMRKANGRVDTEGLLAAVVRYASG